MVAGSRPPDPRRGASGASPSFAARVRRVVMPPAAPGLATAGLFPASFVCNDFLPAVTLTSSPDAFTVLVAVANFSGSQRFEVQLGTIRAASVVITIPLVALMIIFQERIVAGMTAGAVKG
jgi:multiple sugar transport system permease protein